MRRSSGPRTDDGPGDHCASTPRRVSRSGRPYSLLVGALLLLAGCGSGIEERGSIGWDAGEAVIEIQGEGAFTLEVNNNGGVDLELHGRNPVNKDWNRVPLKKGGSVRHKVRAPRIYTLTPSAQGDASVTYVVRSEADLAVSTRIEP